MSTEFVSSQQIIDLQAMVQDLRAENARLQERVKELTEDKQKQQEYIGELIDSRGHAWNRRREFEEAWRRTERERDGYKALAERRKEALEAARQFILEKHGICLALVQLDETIAMTPEGVRETVRD